MAMLASINGCKVIAGYVKGLARLLNLMDKLVIASSSAIKFNS